MGGSPEKEHREIRHLARARAYLHLRNTRDRGDLLLTFVFLVLLGLAWVAVFLPAAARARQGTPLSTAERFRRRMQLIAPPPASSRGRWIVVPESTDRLAYVSYRKAQERRRKVFLGLLVATSASFLVSVVTGAVWAVTSAAGFSLFAYVVLLIGVKRKRQDVRNKIQPLHRPATARSRDLQPARASGAR